jgi:Fe-S cluster biogenesis protein NfuA
MATPGGKNVCLRLRGACCPHAMVTLKNGIEETLRREIDPEILVERAE